MKKNTKDQPLISILVPVYNGANFLPYSIKSLVDQTYTNLEIIVVDDGSTDESVVMIEALYGKRVILLKQSHQGKNSGLNKALSKSTGEFIINFDQDDYIPPDYIYELYTSIIKSDADCAIARFEIIGDSCKVKRRNHMNLTIKDEVYQKEEILDQFFNRNIVALWVNLFKRHILYDFKWPEKYVIDDLPTSYLLMQKCNRVVYSANPVYYHYSNPSSMTRLKSNVMSLEYNQQLIDIYHEIVENLKFKFGSGRFILNRFIYIVINYHELSQLNFRLNLLDKYDSRSINSKFKIILLKFLLVISRFKIFNYMRYSFLIRFLKMIIVIKNYLRKSFK